MSMTMKRTFDDLPNGADSHPEIAFHGGKFRRAERERVFGEKDHPRFQIDAYSIPGETNGFDYAGKAPIL